MNRDSWDSLSIALHWLTAALIVGLAALGWMAVSWPVTPWKFVLFEWHKSLGVITALVVLLRLAWRALRHGPPPSSALTPLERRLAGAAHLLLYAVMIALFVTGYLYNSATQFPLTVFGLVTLPNVTGESEALAGRAAEFHLLGFWLLAGLVVLHVAATVRHDVFRHDRILRRMLPARWRHP